MTRQLPLIIPAALVLTGCAATTSRVAEHHASPPVVTTSSAPHPNGPPADAVALAGVRAMLSSDTTRDADPNATVRRATVWLTPQFAAQADAYPPVAAPGAQWEQWTLHRAAIRVTATLAADDHPADTPSAATRQVIAELHPTGRDGWTGPTETRVVFVILTLLAAGWRIASERSAT